MTTVWENNFAQRTRGMSNSAIRELLKLTEQPDMISFSGGLPAPEVFPIEAIRAATERVLRDLGPQALQYGMTEGYTPLRAQIAQEATQRGPTVGVENILITSGSQQALDLIGKVLLDPGDRVVVEAPTYVGAMQAWTPYGAQYVPVPMDEEGIRTDELEAVLATKPKMMYIMPNFQNPSGVTLSLPRRQQLVELAQKYQVPVIEDDPYGELRFEGEPLPALLSLDGHAQDPSPLYNGNVIRLSTFSKTLAPGLRLAWVVAPAEVIQKLVQSKQGADLHSSTLIQMIAYDVSGTGLLEQHVPIIRQTYRERRDVMLQALTDHCPPGVTWTRPQGGMFLWLTLPEGVDATEVLRMALHEKVAFVPGANFYSGGGGENTLRLNFSNASPDKIRAGIARLGHVLHTAVAEAASVKAR